MMVERELRITNVEIAGIASHCLCKPGAISDIATTHDPLSQSVVEMFHRGDNNEISLANWTISKFEAVQFIA